MTDEPVQPTNVEFVYSTDDIRHWQENVVLLKYVKTFLSRMTIARAKKLMHYIILLTEFKCSDLYPPGKTMYVHNRTVFNPNEDKTDGVIKVEYLREMRQKLLNKVQNVALAKRSFEEGESYEVDSAIMQKGDGKMFVNGMVDYQTIRKVLCDENGELVFAYKFDNPDIPLGDVYDTDNLIHTKVQIISKGIAFDFPLSYIYTCTKCEHTVHKKAYQVVSTNNSINCENDIAYTTAQGEIKQRVCNTKLYPDKNLTTVYPALFYNIAFDVDDEKEVADAIGLKNHKPGFYDCVMYKLPNPSGIGLYMIIDVKEVPPKEFKLPENNKAENYLFTLQKSLDQYISDHTGVKIFGLNPIKCGLILGKLIHALKERLVFNTMIVGDASTGKSLLLKYYSFLLYNYYNMSTNGLSVSVAGLRGTRSSVTLFNKSINVVTIGHLGTKQAIHVDEAGENKELVQNLKSFLLEDNYSYDRAGSVGISHKRTAHVNLSQNLDYDHVGQYRGAIRKAYKDMEVKIGPEDKEEWDEEWDLFQPIHKYDNSYLRKMIKEKRMEYKLKQIWWIDGLDYALHERFPLYFYIVNEASNEELDKVIRHNSSNKMISENLEIIRALHTEGLDDYFAELGDYQFCEGDDDAYVVVEKIIKQYGLQFDSRMKTAYYMLVRMSRIINKRNKYNEQDFDLVRLFLETTNTKLEVAHTNTYTIEGPPDLEKQKELDTIEEESKEADSEFGLPTGDF